VLSVIQKLLSTCFLAIRELRLKLVANSRPRSVGQRSQSVTLVCLIALSSGDRRDCSAEESGIRTRLKTQPKGLAAHR